MIVRHIVEISEDIPFLLPNYHEQRLSTPPNTKLVTLAPGLRPLRAVGSGIKENIFSNFNFTKIITTIYINKL